jgi:hypothetical protein
LFCCRRPAFQLGKIDMQSSGGVLTEKNPNLFLKILIPQGSASADVARLLYFKQVNPSENNNYNHNYCTSLCIIVSHFEELRTLLPHTFAFQIKNELVITTVSANHNDRIVVWTKSADARRPIWHRELTKRPRRRKIFW